MVQIKDKEGCPYAGVGYGDTTEKALVDTRGYFEKYSTRCYESGLYKK